MVLHRQAALHGIIEFQNSMSGRMVFNLDSLIPVPSRFIYSVRTADLSEDTTPFCTVATKGRLYARQELANRKPDSDLSLRVSNRAFR